MSTLNVGSPGVHTINVWMRESGMVFDKLVLTTNPAYRPTGTGPTESQTSGIFFDDFGSDTTSGYDMTNTLTGGGVGEFTYDSQGKRAEVVTGQNIGLKFAKNLARLTSGAFKIEFLPVNDFGGGGTFSLRLKENDATYYEINNSTASGTGFVRKVVAGQEVERAVLQGGGYSQGKNYHLLIYFSPVKTMFLAFGESLALSLNAAAVAVQSFEVELKQQNGFFDNIEFTDTPFDTMWRLGTV